MKLDALDSFFAFSPALKKCNKKMNTNLAEVHINILTFLLICSSENGYTSFNEILENLNDAAHPITKETLRKKLECLVSNGYIKYSNQTYSLSPIGSKYMNELENDMEEIIKTINE